MRLGWMQEIGPTTPTRTLTQVQDALLQADRLGFALYHLGLGEVDLVTKLQKPRGTRLVVPFSACNGLSPKEAAAWVKSIHNHLGGRLVLGVDTSILGALCAPHKLLNAVLAECASSPGMDVLMLNQDGSDNAASCAASQGFDLLSSHEQTSTQVARHWPRIVAGATHATRRACPSQWHLARAVYVHDDPTSVSAYVARQQKSVAKTLIAGSAKCVASRLRQLRERAGPFGTLHCVGVGLSSHEAAEQRQRMATDVLPQVQGATRREAPELVLQ